MPEGTLAILNIHKRPLDVRRALELSDRRGALVTPTCFCASAGFWDSRESFGCSCRVLASRALAHSAPAGFLMWNPDSSWGGGGA